MPDKRAILFQGLKSLGFLRVSRFIKHRKGQVTVLCLHRVSNENSPAWQPMRVEVFDRLMCYVAENYRAISCREYGKISSNEKPQLLITFDDGYKDFIENALPILKKYQLPVVVNVAVNCIETGKPIWTQRLNKIMEAYLVANSKVPVKLKNTTYDDELTPESISSICTKLYLEMLELKENQREEVLAKMESECPCEIKNTPIMSWDDLKICLDNNVEIGSHTMTHHNLSQENDDVRLNYELESSRKMIQEKLSCNCEIIAFPNGQYNQKVITQSVAAGYKYLLTVDEKMVVPEKKPPYLIPRLLIHHHSYLENCFKTENFHNLIRSIF